MAIISPYSSSSSSYVTAGQQVAVPPQQYPSCLRRLIGWGGYWRWLRARCWSSGSGLGAVGSQRQYSRGTLDRLEMALRCSIDHGRERVTQTVLNSNKVGL